MQASAPLLLDGATGTELERLGVDCALPLWSARALLDAPGVVEAIHRSYAQAGVDLVTANTFRTQRRTLARAGLGDRARELTALAVELARRACARAARPPLVLGSAPPLEDCYEPSRVPDDAALAREHGEHARHLAEAGVDAVLVETMNTTREAVAAARAAREAGLDCIVSFVPDAGGRLLSGEPLGGALDAVAALAPLAVGVNCGPPAVLARCLPALRATELPVALYPNSGAFSPDGVAPVLSPDAFATALRGWGEAGARFLGGCCGTGPAHLAAARRAWEAAG
jgi:S-methylmethionine-dependent homocysteine/selenocysteine methylase